MQCITCRTGMDPLTADLFTCNSCKLVSSKLKADLNLYDRAYYEKYVRYRDTDLGHKLVDLRQKLLKKYIPKGNVLDMGCAVGAFHQSLNHGLIGHGFDINEHYGFKEYALLIDGAFDAMTMWDVVEHMDDPGEVVKFISPKYLFICTPSLDDCKDEITKWRHYRPREHVHMFCAESLGEFFERLGYSVIEINYDESLLRCSGGIKNILTMVGVKNGTY